MWTDAASTRITLNTIRCIVLVCFLLPFFFISYATVALSRQLWIIILFWRYPWLKRTKIHGIKSFVDRSRNPEVLCVLMEMEGEIDIVQLREEFLHHISDCSSNHMRLCLPQFILPFMSCWNKYSWLKGTSSADEHIILAPAIQRGRPMKELMCLLNNTNAATSSKDKDSLITSSKPVLPWQIVCIPVVVSETPNECSDKCVISNYLLYAIDLKLLNEAEKRNLSYIPLNGYLERAEPMCDNVLAKPYYIPRLWNYIFSSVHYRWNEFVYQHDPLESPDIDRKQYTGMGQLLSALCISVVYVCGDFVCSFRSIKGSPLDKIDYLQRLIEREIDKRNLTIRTIWDTFLQSIEPVNLLKEATFLVWKIGATVTLMVPWYAWRETEALLLYISKGTLNSDTIVGFIIECFPICYGVALECLRMLWLLLEVILQLNE
ncbi:uncharacterized protein LOC128303795 isoform X2 [Anopheles moucheti]|uniref:uncharacterized protein LOC128303795 isoform X2 n=1 Tax=Anopheles moucheti TaxID=186751 RepID=UPI0022EFDE84|nr:uncharacterized protein LOC128303795 isoform X2 [Anopheles moucheti]